jgi:hypothetical protein
MIFELYSSIFFTKMQLANGHIPFNWDIRKRLVNQIVTTKQIEDEKEFLYIWKEIAYIITTS